MKFMGVILGFAGGSQIAAAFAFSAAALQETNRALADVVGLTGLGLGAAVFAGITAWFWRL